MLFEWDAAKDRSNRRKHHGLDFETASRVFADPGSRSRIERVVGDETRWQTVGMVGDQLLLVAHTWEGTRWRRNYPDRLGPQGE